jgi:hypothetical protein
MDALRGGTRMKKLVIMLSALVFLFGCGGGGSSKKTPPVVSVSLTPSTQTNIDQGQTLNYTATVTNDSKAAGVTWSLSGTACTGTACGTFTGSTTSGAVYNAPATVSAKTTVTVIATSVADTTKSSSSTVVVTPAPSISTTSLANGAVGTAYSATLAATGGAGTLSWSLATGSSLPAGLSLSSAGAISGTPTSAGKTSFTVKVTDASGGQPGPVSQTQQLSLTIAPPAIVVSIHPNAQTSIDQAQTLNFTATLTNDSTNAGVTWSISGTTCTGAACGVFTNSTVSAATYNAPATVASNVTVTVTATSIADPTKSMSSTVVVTPAPSVTTTTLTDGTEGTAYSATLQATGGAGSLTWALASGSSLPAGLSLGSSGAISGTPSAAGTTKFTVKVTDASGGQQGPVSATKQLSLVVEPSPLTVVTTSLPSGVANAAYTEPLQASGGTPPYTWTVAPGSSLPSWLTISGSGTSWTISGTPTTAGTSNFSLVVTDSSTPQQSQTQALSVTINKAAACSDTGSESLLKGQYAFMLSGYSESGFLAAIGSFTADGSGKITAGLIDSNGTLVQSDVILDTTQSFYRVGPNHLGCLTIVTSSGTFTTKLSVGEIMSNVATQGRLVEWDDATNPNYLSATGQIRQQTVPSNLTSGNYVYQLAGAYGSSHQYRTGVVGMIAAKAGSSGGTITGGEYDINVEGVINDGSGLSKPYSGITGAYSAPDPTTGRFTHTTTLDGVTANHVGYMLSSSEFLELSTDVLTSDTSVLVGGAQLQGGSLSLTTGSNLVYYATGTTSAEIGLINVTGATSYTATYYEDVSGGPEAPQTPSCTYSIDTLGRMAASGATCTMYLTSYSKMYPPVFYLYAAGTGYLMGTGLGVYLGQVEPQVAPDGGFSATSVSGTYYAGDTEVVNQAVSAESLGVEVLTLDGSGSVDIVGDYIGDYTGTSVTQVVDQTQNTTIGTVNSNGTFNTKSSYGQINAIMISITKVVDIDDSTQADPVIQVINPVNPET